MSEEKEIKVSKAELDALLEQNRELMAQLKEMSNVSAAQNTPAVKKKKVIRVSVATIDGLPVVEMVNKGTEDQPWYFWNEKDPNRPDREIMLVDLVALDPKTGKKKVYERINWIEFQNQGGKKECDVLKRQGEEWIIENGLVTKRVVPEGDHYNMEELDIQVPSVVEGKSYNYVVDFDGEPVEIHEKFVNMIK